MVHPVSGAQYVDTGVHVSPRVNDNSTVTFRGSASLDTLLDDLDQSPADETVEFGLDGVTYEIDLLKAEA